MGGLRDNLHRRASLEQLFETWIEENRKKGEGPDKLLRDLLFMTRRWLEEQAVAHRIWKKPEAVEALYEAITWRLHRQRPDGVDPAVTRIEERLAAKAARRVRREQRRASQ